MIHMIGNAHIDPVWLWDWREGYQEVKATFRSALDRLSENDEFVFTCACADYYRYVEENAPDMFEEIRMRVAQGRWVIVGGMWIQPDCNMPSGEAFARQLLYSQRYFMAKFGRAAVTGYNVDSFGHGATLPQLLAGAGIRNYVFMRPGKHENADIPAPLFTWTAPDGSSVTAFRIPDSYGSAGFGQVPRKIECARTLSAEYSCSMMCFYGVGNHGGGPTIANLKEIDTARVGGATDVIYSSPDAFFEEVKKSGYLMPEWRRELQHHSSGCYSACSTIKRMNRRAENALFQAERLGVLAHRKAGWPLPSMKRGFENLMFNQFHDILCGCCIRETYDDALMQLGEAVSVAHRAQTTALHSLSWRVDTSAGIPVRRSKDSDFALWEHEGRGTPVVVFNACEFEAEGAIQVMGKVSRATDETGVDVPVQTVRASRTNGTDKWDSLFPARVPALGWRLYWLYLAGEQEAVESPLKIMEHCLENDFVAARFDSETGALVSLYNKKGGFEALRGVAGVRLFDIERADTWAHGEFTFDQEVGAFGDAKFEVLERGPVRVKLRVTTTHGSSSLIQEYSLCAQADQIEVEARLDLREKFRMVKFCFDTGLIDAVTHAEIAYGVVQRDMRGTEEVCQRFVDIGGSRGGLCVLNDGKYSFSALKGELRLTVANSSIYADHYGQATRDADCQHMDMGEQTFRYALIPHAGDWSACTPQRRAVIFHQPLEKVVETYHEGDLPVKYEGLSVSAENLAVGAVKRAERGEGWILRLNETKGRHCEAKLSAPVFDREIEIRLAPWQIQTLYVPDDPMAACEEVLLTEYPIQKEEE